MIPYILYRFFGGLVLFILWYVVIVNGAGVVRTIIALVLVPGRLKKSRGRDLRLMRESQDILPISLLVPARNGEQAVVDSVKSMLRLNYLNYEIVVINDGSTDNTLEAVINAFNLRKVVYPIRERLPTKKVRGIYCNPDNPRLILLDKENGGKADALNAGLNLSRYPYFAALDSEYILETDALSGIATAFVQDKHTIATGGIIRVVNGCRIKDGEIVDRAIPDKIWPLFQTLEYFRSFTSARMGWSRFLSLFLVSGAFAAFQKENVVQTGGYSVETTGEDMELMMKLNRYMRGKKYRYRLRFLPDPICWKQAPETLKALSRQRARRQAGLADVLHIHKGMLLRPGCGFLGLVMMPGYHLFEKLRPFIEILGYILIPLAVIFGLVDADALVLFLAASIGMGMVTSIGSIAVEDFTNSRQIRTREILLLGLLCIPENLFYRQLTLLFRAAGMFGYGKDKHGRESAKHQKPGAPRQPPPSP